MYRRIPVWSCLLKAVFSNFLIISLMLQLWSLVEPAPLPDNEKSFVSVWCYSYCSQDVDREDGIFYCCRVKSCLLIKSDPWRALMLILLLICLCYLVLNVSSHPVIFEFNTLFFFWRTRLSHLRLSWTPLWLGIKVLTNQQQVLIC